MNEVLKSLSPQQLEDFRNRWEEVFKNRVEEIENQFCVHQKANTTTYESSVMSQFKSFPKFNLYKNSFTNSEKLRLFKDLLCIEKLHCSAKIEARITDFELLNDRFKKNCDFSFEANDNTKIVNINIKLFNDNEIELTSTKSSKLNGGLDSLKTSSEINLICKVLPSYLLKDFSSRDAMKLLLKRLKCLFRNKKNNIRKEKKCEVNKRKYETLSCQNQFSIYCDSDFENGENKMKNDAVSIRLNHKFN